VPRFALKLAELASRLCRSTVRKGLPFRKLAKDITSLRLELQA